jgi:hypothetical protein
MRASPLAVMPGPVTPIRKQPIEPYAIFDTPFFTVHKVETAASPLAQGVDGIQWLMEGSVRAGRDPSGSLSTW